MEFMQLLCSYKALMKYHRLFFKLAKSAASAAGLFPENNGFGTRPFVLLNVRCELSYIITSLFLLPS